ncbi:MAG: GTP pyrophosphokinase family protein, partial [Clostridia bacterium]|nr:GTP pyrophosphokinase family protein [Clostridia bacterium]
MQNELHIHEKTQFPDQRQRYAEMMQLYDAAIREVRTKLEILDSEFRVRYARNPIHHIDSRLKSRESMCGKLKRKGLPETIESAEEHLTDIAGIRVICNYVDDIYLVAKLLTRQRDVEMVEEKDYIKN